MDELVKIVSNNISNITKKELKKAEKEILIKELLEKHTDDLKISAGLKKKTTLR